MPGTIRSVERAAAVMKLLAAGSRRLGVVELSTALQLPKATVHGLLQTLAGVGFVEQDPATAKYQLGPALLRLGNSYLDTNELRARALNWSDGLASRSRESVMIGTLHEGQVLVVHHVFRPDDSFQVLQVGLLRPLHACALGKTLLAHSPEPDPGAPLPAFTARTVVEVGRLRAELEQVAAQGWAQEREELVQGEGSVAAPIRDAAGLVVGAIGVVGAVERLFLDERPREELVGFVRDAARAVTRDLATARR